MKKGPLWSGNSVSSVLGQPRVVDLSAAAFICKKVVPKHEIR